MEVENLMVGFKYIPNYEGLYSIDTEGTVFSHISNKILKPHTNHRGYLMIDLYKDGKIKKKAIHRLVAITYLPNPNNLPEIDYIDTDRQNNNVNNLRWCTRKENCNNPLSLKHAGDSRRGNKNYLFGKHISEEIKVKMSNSKKGHFVSEETRRKIGNANRGRIMSEEQRKSMSIAHKGKRTGKNNPNSRKIKQYTKGMEFLKEWDSISEAERELGISITAISNNLKNRSKTAGGFIWRY